MFGSRFQKKPLCQASTLWCKQVASKFASEREK
jgi:hypothetical protein